jgi:ATP-dependent RNA helicase RhlE
MVGFQDMKLGPRLAAVLAGQGIDTPTPVQAQAIPALMAGRDLVAVAPTGTGKTLAFALPLVRKLEGQGKPAPKAISALVLSPTRELAAQTLETLRALAEGTRLSVVQATGGVPTERQAARLVYGADILVATPGRLTDLHAQGAVSLDDLRHLVLDEADRMLDLGFAPALKRLRRNMPRARQTVMTTATMPPGVAEIAADWMAEPLTIDLTPPSRVPEGIVQQVRFVTQGDKARAVEAHLRAHPGEAALVFCRTRERAEKLADLLVRWGLAAGALHGERRQGQREAALEAFRAGQVAVLVATDIAARGLDIPSVRLVINHDLPVVPETYVHRIGRTGRAGAAGLALSLVAPAEMADLAGIEALTGVPLAVAGGVPWPAEMAEDARRKAGLPMPRDEGQATPPPARKGKPRR